MDWFRRLPRASWFFVRGFVTSVAGNLSLAALSIGLALSLWLFVTNAENPTERQTFNSAIEIGTVNVPNGLAVANVSANTVRIEIEAPANELDSLSAEDFTAEVNLGGLTPGKVTVPVSVRARSSEVRIVRTTPEQVEITLENLRTKEVPVRIALVGSPQQGFAAGEQQVDPATATISGPQSLVELVDSATAEVPLTGLRVDYTEDRVTLAPRDARGGEIGRVSVSPETAGVSVKILQREFSLEFSVNPTIAGIPAAGYNVVSIAVDPSTVRISGSLDILQTIDPIAGISTSEISISDARASVVQQVELDLPTGVGVIGSNQVVVTVTIAPARGEVSFLVTPQVRSVREGLVVTTATPVYVTLTGDVPTLRALTAESIVVVADAAGLEAGLHVLALDITAPAGTTLAKVEPGELGIALTLR